jgi:hypothetical protein
MAKYPTLTHSDETGFAELTPAQQTGRYGSWALAEAVVAQSGKILGAHALEGPATATSVPTTTAPRRPPMDVGEDQG